MELLLAIAIVGLAAGGLGLGLLFGRGPARTSCGAAEDLAMGRCADCPLRKGRADRVAEDGSGGEGIGAGREASCRNTA